MSLNLALPSDFNTNLNTIIASLTPRFAEVDLSIPMLNNQKTRVAPRNRDENLESGWLQLPSGTRCLIDMRGITEGKLDDNGKLDQTQVASCVLIRTSSARRAKSAAFCDDCGSAESVLRIPLLVI